MTTSKNVPKNIQNKNINKKTNQKENKMYDSILLNKYYQIY